MDWVSHACPNATLVEAAEPVSVFVPYWGEDMATPEDLAKLAPDAPPFQAHSVTTRLPNDTLVQTLVPALVQADMSFKRQVVASATRRGLPPYGQEGVHTYNFIGRKYSVEIWESGHQEMAVHYDGDLGTDAVYSESNVSRIKKLAGFADWFAGKGSKLDIWPDPGRLSSNDRFPLKGRLNVEIVSGEHKLRFDGSYDLRSAKYRPGIVGGAKKWLDPRTRKKFRDSTSGGLAEMFHLAGRSAQGVEIFLIFQIIKGGDSAILRDVEFLIEPRRFYGPASKETINSVAPISLDCNPRSLSDVMALAMGLELRLTKARVAGQPLNEALDNSAGIIRKHARALEQGTIKLGVDDEVPMDVNTAIYIAVNGL
jgi:hypothetical protein